MNTAAFMMQNGTPCLIYDEPIPHVREIEFCHDDHLLTLIFGVEGSAGEGRIRMDYPLSEHIVSNLLKMGIAAIGRMNADRKIEDLHITPVVVRAA
jgi:hypothetical protein